MSRKMTKSDLSRADISLLINSEEPKNSQLYGNLYDTLIKIKTLKAITLEELKNHNLNQGGISALTHSKQDLIDNTTKEWRATTDIIDNPKKISTCQLCNKNGIRYERHIRNMKNNTELLVGSECVTRFKIDGYLEQEKQLSEIRKRQKIIQRRNEFYSHFPDYEEFISDAEKYFSTLPILLPYDLYNTLQNTINRMRLISTKYVNEGKKAYYSQYDSFTLFQQTVDSFSKLKVRAELHINKNLNKILVCERQEIDWLISENKMKLLQQISENNGIYTLYTLKNMDSINFIQKYIESILSKNISDIMKFEKIKDNKIIFSFNKFGYQSPILYNIKLKDFMQNIGANCIINNAFTYGSKEILKVSTIINSKRNLISILEYIDSIMNLLNCTFLIDDISNSLYLYRKGDRAIRKFSHYYFMQSYSNFILLSDEEIKKFLISIISNNDVNWISNEMQSKQGIDEKIGVLYKAYKESHEYTIRPTGRIVELMTYSVYNNNVTGMTKIDFNSAEYVALQKNKLKDYQLRSVEYGLRINDESLSPFYHKGDLLLVQSIQKFKSDAELFFASNNEIIIKKCHSETEESESIFNYTNIPKKELVAYGRIICCIHSDSEIENTLLTNLQNTLIQDKVKIFVVDNPKICFDCSSKCTYKNIQYVKENTESRKINVAVCPICNNKYFISKNAYLAYMKSKKETNLDFILLK